MSNQFDFKNFFAKPSHLMVKTFFLNLASSIINIFQKFIRYRPVEGLLNVAVQWWHQHIFYFFVHPFLLLCQRRKYLQKIPFKISYLNENTDRKSKKGNEKYPWRTNQGQTDNRFQDVSYTYQCIISKYIIPILILCDSLKIMFQNCFKEVTKDPKF